MKEKCVVFVHEKVERVESHDKLLAPDGLVRVLVAREYNVAKASEMYQKWVNWRLEFKAD